MTSWLDNLSNGGKFIGLVGIPGALCFILVFAMLVNMASAAQVKALDTKMSEHTLRMEQTEGLLNEQLETLIRLGRLQCVAQQKTESGRAACLVTK